MELRFSFFGQNRDPLEFLLSIHLVVFHPVSTSSDSTYGLIVLTELNSSLEGFVTVFWEYGGVLHIFQCLIVSAGLIVSYRECRARSLEDRCCQPDCDLQSPCLLKEDVWLYFLLVLTMVGPGILCLYKFSWMFLMHSRGLFFFFL